MRGILFIILYFLLLSLPSEIFASGNVGQSIKRISPDGGFTLAPVMEISQDHLGFIWFITREKLYQYNSQDFIIYNPQFPTNISQANNNISCLLIDKSNRIWVGTNVGLNIFNDTKEQLNFVALRDPDNSDRLFNIIDIKQNNNGEIWLLDGSNLARLDTATMQVEYIKHDQSRLLVNAFCFDKAGNIYAANNQGRMYHIQTTTFQAEKLPVDMSSTKLHGMYLIDNVLWVTTDGFGFRRYSTGGKLLGSYPDISSTSAFNVSTRIREVTQTSDGKIWIATYKGMLQWDDDIIMQVINNDDGANSLPDNSVVALFEDNQKGLWIGTWRGGLAYLNPYSNTFKTFSHSKLQNSVANNLINVITEDKDGNIWIGTDGNGMDVYDEEKNLFVHLLLEGESQTNAYNVKSILCESDGDIWVGTFREGIFYRKKGDKDFSRKLLSNENVYDLVSDENGLWIATFSSGLYYCRFEDNSLSQYTYDQNDPTSLPSNHLRKLLIDKDKNLWIISNAGVTIKPYGKNTFERLLIERMNKSGTIQIYSIISDKEGKIWLGTDQGMLSIDNQTREIKSHPLLFNGKPVSVYGMVSLQDDQMWISSNFGIFSYNLVSESYLNYSTIDGLPGNLFNAGALCYTSTEQIWLGGTSGLVVFNPKKMQINPYMPKVYFSKIFINHKEVLTNQLNSPLQKPLYKTEVLKLKPAQNSFSIEFVALNYLNSQKNQFKYRLKGFDRDWVESGYNARATYTNIPPGKYVFEVLSCNNDMVWSEDPGRLEILIPPPILLSRVAIILYILLSIFLMLLARRVMLNREKLKGQIEIERVYRQQEEKTHQEKLTFFTNISHELRTPLTLISGPVDELLNSDGIDQIKYNYLTLIKRNSDRLLKLINQLLDFRKIENQKMDLLVYETDMVPFVHNIFEYFQDIARQRGINYLFVSLSEKFPATFDGDKLDKAIFNLLSNAFKFTPEKGTVQVELIVDRKSRTTSANSKSNVFCDGVLTGDQFIQISVEDNGEGIAEQHLSKIFDRFYRGSGSEPSQSGTGIGLNLTRNLILMHGGEIEVESTLGKGSVFRIRIPCDKNYLQKLQVQSGIEIHKLSKPFGDENLIKVKKEEFVTFTEIWPATERGQNSNEKLILVVEDNQDLRNFIQQVLSDHYCIIMCNNGSEGVEKARLFLPDLIISDIVMPEKSGIEMLKELKADISTSHIPIILLTALTTDENKIEGFTLGADDYIEKPFNSEVLKARLKNLFDNRAALQQLYVGKISQGFVGDKADSPDQKLLLKALRFVEKNIADENLGIDLLASHLNLSRSTLHRKLKALTNKSASDFIRTVRLAYAARLLREGLENIDEISVMSGFNSHSYFTRSFKEHFNKTPSDFVQLHKETK